MLILGPLLKVAYAATPTNIRDSVSTTVKSSFSTHSFQFTLPAQAVTINETITIKFPLGSTYNFTGIVIGDITMSYGPTTGRETNATIAASNDTSIWGAVFSDVSPDNRTLTLTAPSSGSLPSASDIVIINYASTHSQNPSTAGTYNVQLSGTFSSNDSSITNIAEIITDTATNQVSLDSDVTPNISLSLSGQSIDLGTISTSGASTSAGTTFIVGTNNTTGMAVTVSGNTLTSGGNTITAMATAAASSPGSEQFGINLMDNTAPDIGASSSPSGSGYGTAAAGYNTLNIFKFVSGDIIASSAEPIANTTFTVSYLANIAAATEPGHYSTAISFTATASF